ncbi:MAG: TRAP transporter permease [Deltaproteobacteria bacterium]|nr:TRAP transporter permease [Deltaproteobacteria bacterium]MBW2306747.1 TRAP transporter permease [Deltaproteobacteria bacterium]
MTDYAEISHDHPQKGTPTTFEVGSRYLEPSGALKIVVGIIGASLTLFEAYTAQFGLLVANKQRSVLLAFGLALAFLLYPSRFKKKAGIGLFDVLLAACGFASTIYILVVFDQLALRQGWPTQTDFIMGLLTIIFVTLAGYRVGGWILPTICLFFLTYCYWGRWIPGRFGHRGFSVISIVRHMYLSTEGIFGLPLGVVSDFIYLFIFFGVILTATGVGKVFIDLALAALGGSRGGPAKVGVLASGFFGTINGSSVANVVGTGTFTIPLMKSIGYRPYFAAATEACASCGGQLMPPIMGAAAFIMAEFIGVSYLTVALAAALPGVLYYVSVLVSVHFEAVRNDLKGLSKDQLPSLKRIILKDGFMLLPIPVIILFLVRGYTPTMAALWAIYMSLLLPLFNKEKRYRLKDLYAMLGRGATSALELIIICSLIGFIIGASTLTGFGLKLAGAIVDLAGGYLLPVLFLTMIASIILGAGIPTTGNYIMMALLTAPALKLMNIQAINAHLFVFYFGIISDLTPPVALAALVAAGLAGAPFWKTALTSTKLAVAGFIIPYMFVLSPDLLISAENFSMVNTLFTVITAVIGVIALAGAVQNFFYLQLKIHERIPLFFGAFLLISPNLTQSLIGFLLMSAILFVQIQRSKSGNFQKSIEFGKSSPGVGPQA